MNADAREKNDELYCLRCHDKMGIPICGACRRPIEERVVHALGKAWHVEHFVCAKCEKPFFGTRHYEKKGLAYCENHYHQSSVPLINPGVSVILPVLSVTENLVISETKFFEFDLKPVCRMCHEKFPSELRKRLKKYHEEQAKK
ncbi:hypothetical protein KUTeg_012290 [Tegillarca granosa]|uniref:LIM zinc-binding domain-containing protein n=1 Tax=Tegillarca granosa TaxID=220873 RepID=A0ABQ9F492_TEGGR|nr:hypothetical protein KUTeg_012290 [Tegillarca granosa]